MSLELYHIFPEPQRQHASLELPVLPSLYGYGMAELPEKLLILPFPVRVAKVLLPDRFISTKQIQGPPDSRNPEQILLLVIDDEIVNGQPVCEMGHQEGDYFILRP